MSVVGDDVTLALARLGDGLKCDACVLGQIIDLPVRCFNDILEETNLLSLDQFEVPPVPTTCANPFWPANLIAVVRTSTGDPAHCNCAYVNANKGKVSLRMFFCIERDSWLFVCGYSGYIY